MRLAKEEYPRFIVTSFAIGRRKPCTKICIVPGGETHEHPRARLESIAVVFLLLRLCAHRDPASAGAQCGTIRLKLFKIGAQVRLSVRKIWIGLSCTV
jgi:hypothetical protein